MLFAIPRLRSFLGKPKRLQKYVFAVAFRFLRECQPPSDAGGAAGPAYK